MSPQNYLLYSWIPVKGIEDDFAAHRAVFERVAAELMPAVKEAARTVNECLRAGGKLLVFGNGGSASDAQHIAAELTGRYVRERRALAAIALTSDGAALTAIGNDFGYEQVFARQLQGLARPGDVVIGITTSGTSPNVLRALETARALDCRTIGLTGRDGGRMREFCDQVLVVPAQETARIQEMHILIGHSICAEVDREFAP
jgi:D-sedoheptulose 7-phosphate isomerase